MWQHRLTSTAIFCASSCPLTSTTPPTSSKKTQDFIITASRYVLTVKVDFFFLLHLHSGRDKTPVRLPGAIDFLCGATRSSWQLANRASKVAPESLKLYTFSDFTLRYFELIRRRLPLVGHSEGDTEHRREKSGQVRINSGQVDLSRSLPQGQAAPFSSRPDINLCMF